MPSVSTVEIGFLAPQSVAFYDFLHLYINTKYYLSIFIPIIVYQSLALMTSIQVLLECCMSYSFCGSDGNRSNAHKNRCKLKPMKVFLKSHWISFKHFNTPEHANLSSFIHFDTSRFNPDFLFTSLFPENYSYCFRFNIRKYCAMHFVLCGVINFKMNMNIRNNVRNCGLVLLLALGSASQCCRRRSTFPRLFIFGFECIAPANKQTKHSHLEPIYLERYGKRFRFFLIHGKRMKFSNIWWKSDKLLENKFVDNFWDDTVSFLILTIQWQSAHILFISILYRTQSRQPFRRQTIRRERRVFNKIEWIESIICVKMPRYLYEGNVIHLQ